MAFKDLQEHLEETFAINHHERIVEGMLWVRAQRAAYAREQYILATGHTERLKPGFAPWQTREGRNAKRRARQQARRDSARGGPKTTQSWRLSAEQRDWARTNGLTLTETAKQLGVSTQAVASLRKKGK